MSKFLLLGMLLITVNIQAQDNGIVVPLDGHRQYDSKWVSNDRYENVNCMAGSLAFSLKHKNLGYQVELIDEKRNSGTGEVIKETLVNEENLECLFGRDAELVLFCYRQEPFVNFQVAQINIQSVQGLFSIENDKLIPKMGLHDQNKIQFNSSLFSKNPELKDGIIVSQPLCYRE